MNFLQIVFDFLFLIIGLYLVFGKNYLSEKGKNLATKEDIRFITQEIETVKNDIQSSTQHKNEYLKESKEVALIFNDNATFFIDYSSKVLDILANNSKNKEIILKQIEDIRLQGAKVVSSFLKIFIYYDSTIPLTESAQEYYNTVVKIQSLAISILFQLEQFAQKEDVLLDSFKGGQLHYADEIREIIIERKKLIENHIKERQYLLENEIHKSRGIYIAELSKIVRTKIN